MRLLSKRVIAWIRSHERQRHGLACLDAGIGTGCGVLDAYRRAGLEPGEVLPGGEEGLLDGVLSVLDRAQDAVAVQLQLPPVPLDQLGKGVRIAGLRPGDKIGVDENPPIRVAAAV